MKSLHHPDDSVQLHPPCFGGKSRRKKVPVWVYPLTALFLLAGIAGFPRLGQGSTLPKLSVEIDTNNNMVLLTVINGTNNEFYEIYATNSLSDNSVWSLSMTGALGVTNFSVPIGAATRNFFKARAGNDWDGDGIPNFQDVNPNSFNTNDLLSVTIDSPANGSTIQ